MQGGACTDDEVRVYCYKVVRVKVHCILEGRFLPMSETSNYYSSTSGHLCDLDLCTLRTSLKLHTFGRRFYGYRYWSPVMTMHVSSSNGWTPTLVRVAQQQHLLC